MRTAARPESVRDGDAAPLRGRQVRRWFDRQRFRWQARLDGAWADRVIPVAASVGIFVLLASLSLAEVRALEAPVELSRASQGVSLIADGAEPAVTLDGGEHVLARQAALVQYPLGWLAKIVPPVPLLLLTQALALALGVVPLWWIARRHAHLRAGAACTLLFVYAFYPVLHNLNLNGFHPEVIGLPALLGAMYFGIGSRWVPFAVCAGVAVAARADLGLAVAGLGALFAWQGERRAGLITLGVGVGWTALAVAFVQPLFGDGGTAHLANFADFGDTVPGVMWGMVSHPGEVLSALAREDNFTLFVTLFAPVLFLPVLAPRYLVPVLPLQFLYLVADVPEVDRFGQQTVAITAFVFLATTFALAGIGRLGIERITVDSRLLGALVLSATVFFVRDSASSPYREPWGWGAQDLADDARRAAADLVDPRDSVRVSTTPLVLVADRPGVWLVEGPPPEDLSELTTAAVLFLDDADLGWTEGEWRELTDRLTGEEGYDLVFADATVRLFVRS